MTQHGERSQNQLRRALLVIGRNIVSSAVEKGSKLERYQLASTRKGEHKFTYLNFGNRLDLVEVVSLTVTEITYFSCQNFNST